MDAARLKRNVQQVKNLPTLPPIVAKIQNDRKPDHVLS